MKPIKKPTFAYHEFLDLRPPSDLSPRWAVGLGDEMEWIYLDSQKDAKKLQSLIYKLMQFVYDAGIESGAEMSAEIINDSVATLRKLSGA